MAGAMAATAAARGSESTICRLCEEVVRVDDLRFHLVHCTAAHSCHERLRTLDGALLTMRNRVRQRRECASAAWRRVCAAPTRAAAARQLSSARLARRLASAAARQNRHAARTCRVHSRRWGGAWAVARSAGE